jgi:hypothetical protein
MPKTPEKSPVSLVFPAKSPDSPPDSLREAGRRVWADVVSAYDFTDPTGRILLEQLCAATDRLSEVSASIDAVGAVIRVRGQPRPNPCLREELALRSYIGRTLNKLGIAYEPLQATPGRPRQVYDWIPPPR